MIWLKRTGLLLFLLLLLLMSVLAYVTMTNGGMQRVFKLGQSYLSDELTIGEVEGKFIGPGAFRNIHLMQADGVEVSVQSAKYDWRPRQLWLRELKVDYLDVSGVTIRLPESSDSTGSGSKEPFKLSDLRIPLKIEAQRIQVTEIDLYLPGADEPVVIDKVLLRATGEEDELMLMELSVSAPQGDLQLGGSLNTSGDWPIALDSEWRFTHEQFGLFNGSGSMTGNLDDLNVMHQVSGPVDATIDLDVRDVTGELAWDGNIKASAQDLGSFSEALVGTPFTLDTNTSGSFSEFIASGTLTSEHEQVGPFTTRFNLNGNPQLINFTDSTVEFEQSPAKLDLQGSVDLTSLEADITVDWTELVYPLTSAPPQVLSPAGTLRFTGSATDYKVQMNSTVQQEQTGLLNVVLGASGTPNKLTINTLSVEGPPTSVYAVGVVDLETLEVDVKANWKNLRWPLVGDEELISSSAADFTVTGTLDDYQVDARLSLAGVDIPPGDWTLSARGNTSALNDLRIDGEVLEGQIGATGTVIFSPTPEWDLKTTASGINPGVQWSEHPGKVSFTATTSGSMTDSGPDFIANIQDLSGNYRGQAIGGGGKIAFVNGELTTQDVSAKVGSATVDLDGAFGDPLDVTFQLDAEQVSNLLPDASGNIDVEGKLTGSRTEPQLEFKLSAKDFTSGSLTAAALEGEGIVDLTGNQLSKISIDGENIQLSGYRWKTLSVKGEGRPEEHQLAIALQGNSPDLAIALNGGMEQSRWSGSMEQFDLLKTPTGDWKLHEPVKMDASSSSFRSDILCLTQLPAVVCADGRWDSSTGVVARLALESFNSELFGDLLPPDIQADAPLSGTVDFSMQPGGQPKAEALFEIPKGKIQFESKGELITAILGQSSGRVALVNDQLTTTMDLALGEIGTINVDTTITDLSGEQKLAGTVKSEVRDISLAGIGATQLRSIDGSFASDLTLGGTLAAPSIVGDAGLQNFGAEIPSLSLKLREGSIKVSSQGNDQLKVEGMLLSGDGGMEINGFYNPKTGQMEIDLTGEDFQVANAKRQKAVISSDLKVRIDDGTISVDGELGIPSAFIQTGGESGVVIESPDVTVLESSDTEKEPEPESSVKLAIDVSLGDDVRIKTGPFDGALAGGITLTQQPGKVATGSGEIEVVSGDFFVYGQKLTMERGRILFGGGPLDNPAIEFDVARDVAAYDVRAGAAIRGTAQAPILELKSDPQQTDANTLSYILFGKPVGTGVSFTLGKFITPDLFVSYGRDLFERIDAFNVRYRVSKRLVALATRSTISGADLVYTIER